MAVSGPPQIDPRRRPARLRPFLEKNLLAYAAAASAAGFGTLASPQAAEARIVYTATNQKIPYQTPLFIDLNHDGVNDFAVYFFAAERWSHFSAWPANQDGSAGAGIIGYGRKYGQRRMAFASALHAGDHIGPRRNFQQGNAFMALFTQYSSTSIARGPWVYVTNRYLGFKFSANGKFHYGWARLNIQANNGVLTGYAYETTPDKPIVAGRKKGLHENERTGASEGAASRPATLGELARGATAARARQSKE